MSSEGDEMDMEGVVEVRRWRRVVGWGGRCDHD